MFKNLSESDSSSQSQDSDVSDVEETSWITWYLNLRGNEFFCDIDESFLQDDFNLTGLNSIVPYYDFALNTVLGVEFSFDNLTEEQRESVDSAAEMLYGLIHARFIVSNRGMQIMHEKYLNADFGMCPRVYCQGQHLLPVGQSDLPRVSSVNMFCPRCRDIFFPRSNKQADLDGAYFGTSFCHLLLMAHPNLNPPRPAQAMVTFVPRVYGFKIHSSSAYYPAPAAVGTAASPSKSKRDRRDAAAANAVTTSSHMTTAVSEIHIQPQQQQPLPATVFATEALTEEQQMLTAMNQMNGVNAVSGLSGGV